jgi:hypothetical protein
MGSFVAILEILWQFIRNSVEEADGRVQESDLDVSFLQSLPPCSLSTQRLELLRRFAMAVVIY